MTAISLIASDNRATSASAAASSESRALLPAPGLDADNAASAPSLATVRIRTMVERSTPAAVAASAMAMAILPNCSLFTPTGSATREKHQPPRSDSRLTERMAVPG